MGPERVRTVLRVYGRELLGDVPECVCCPRLGKAGDYSVKGGSEARACRLGEKAGGKGAGRRRPKGTWTLPASGLRGQQPWDLFRAAAPPPRKFFRQVANVPLSVCPQGLTLLVSSRRKRLQACGEHCPTRPAAAFSSFGRVRAGGQCGHSPTPRACRLWPCVRRLRLPTALLGVLGFPVYGLGN